MNNYILIDCPPNSMRPDQILHSILLQMNIKVEDFTITNKFFGAWTFVINDGKENEFIQNIDNIVEQLTIAYNSGLVRYVEYNKCLSTENSEN